MAIILLTVLSLILAGPAYAIDHSNLDENRPLLLEDAYPVSRGEWVLEAGAGFSVERHGPDRWVFPLQLVYGAFPNFHFELGTTFFTEPRGLHEPSKSGDLSLAGLYNFNQETLVLPAFGIKGRLNFPTGVDSSGVDLEITGLMTKSFQRLGVHLNGSYEFIGGTHRHERDGQYRFVLGASYPLGAPMHTRTLLASDLFLKQSVRRGEDETVGAEIGLRYQLRERIVVDFGMGTEFSGPRERSRFNIKSGFSFSF